MADDPPFYCIAGGETPRITKDRAVFDALKGNPPTVNYYIAGSMEKAVEFMDKNCPDGYENEVNVQNDTFDMSDSDSEGPTTDGALYCIATGETPGIWFDKGFYERLILQHDRPVTLFTRDMDEAKRFMRDNCCASEYWIGTRSGSRIVNTRTGE